MTSKRTFSWFLLGVGSQLQIIASLSFTELFVFIAAPFIFLREKDYMRRNGIMPFFWLSMLVVVGCVIACIANHTEPMYVIRGMAVTCLLPCTVVVGHWMLRRDMGGFKWMLIGVALSGILCTFIFQKSVEMTGVARGLQGDAAVDAIMSGPIFWITRLRDILNALPKGWYLQCPTFVSIAAPLFMAGFSMLTTTSGRSAALGAIGTMVLILIGGKKRSTIQNRLCNRFVMWCILGIFAVFSLNVLYRISATQGWLGEDALKKYEQQTQGDTSIKKLLLGGRMESFCGLIACVDKPIVGFGPWPMDNDGYTAEFLAKYGTQSDYNDYIKTVEWNLSLGKTIHMIPAHAHITEFWLWYGIFGLVFWLYVIFVFLRYLKQDCWAVPQWYMWIAASIPGYLWSIFFNPWADRIGGIIFIVACLMARAVRLGVQPLPDYMEEEIFKVESK